MSEAKQYKNKSVVIDAMEFIGSAREATSVIDWALASGGTIRYHDEDGEFLFINTLEGTMRASVGDFIIKGVQGDFYPCKPDIFAATYEAVEAPHE